MDAVGQRLRSWVAWAVALGAAAGSGVHAADPARGAQLFANTPRPGLLVCIDCHGSDPVANNFGNIWTGRNAAALIQRAVTSNTGGMGYLGGLYSAADLADIAAYLGNTPSSLQFATTLPGQTSAAQSVTVRASTKLGIDKLALAVEGDFAIVGSSCGASVARFDSCSVDLAFRPTASGARSGALTIAHDGTPTPVRVALAGEGAQRPPPLASVAPARLDFGNAVKGLPGIRLNAALANDGDDRLVVAALGTDSADFRIAGGSCLPGLALEPGARCAVAVQFHPGAGGARTGSLTIAHDGVGGASRVPLAGHASDEPAARLAADGPGVDLGTLAPGSLGPAHTVALRNAGNAAWRWAGIDTTDDAFVIVADGCARAALAPGAACAVAVAFRPARPGWTTGSLRVLGPDGTPVLQLPLAGRARPADGLLAAAPARFEAAVGQTALRTLRVVNQGGATVRLGVPALQGSAARPFALSAAGSCEAGLALPPATGCDAVVAYTPDAAGSHAATLRIDVESGAAPLTLPLAGRAVAVAAPSWSVDTAQAVFAEQAEGEASGGAISVDVTNRGGAPLAWHTLALNGDDASHFAIAGTCRTDTPLPPAARCQVTLRFTPQAAGERRATLVLRASGDRRPTLVTLSGRAVARPAARLEVDVARIDFATQPLLAAPPLRGVTIRNTGSGASPPPRLRVEGPFRIARVDGSCTQALAAGQSCRVELAFVPAGNGPATGRLAVQAGGSRSLDVALAAEAADAAARLEWQSPPTMPADTPVGTVANAAWWTLVNTGNAASAPLRWALSGPAPQDYSLAPSGSCADGNVLTPGRSCTLRVAFHPGAPGLRSARLALLADRPVLEVDLHARAFAPVSDGLRAWPVALAFAAVPGQAAAAQAAWIGNDGTSLIDVTDVALQGPAFVSAPPLGQACPAVPFALLPGDACSVSVGWNGAADGRIGGALEVVTRDAGGALSVPLSVGEDPALRSNVGAGGVSSGWWLLALALVSARLARGNRRRESGDG